MSAVRSQRDAVRIIVTDDDPNKLYHLTKPLRDAGHCVFTAYDGASALELVVQLPTIDLLITNTRLGIVDGATLMRETRRLRPDLPILHVSHEQAEANITPAGVPTPERAVHPRETAPNDRKSPRYLRAETGP